MRRPKASSTQIRAIAVGGARRASTLPAVSYLQEGLDGCAEFARRRVGSLESGVWAASIAA